MRRHFLASSRRPSLPLASSAHEVNAFGVRLTTIPRCRSRIRVCQSLGGKKNQDDTLASETTLSLRRYVPTPKFVELSHYHIKRKYVFGRLPSTEFAREGKYQGFWEVGKGVGISVPSIAAAHRLVYASSSTCSSTSPILKI